MTNPNLTTGSPLAYRAANHEGCTRCWCGCKYWEERTTSGSLSVFCVSCDMDLNETLPGIKRGTVYLMSDEGNPMLQTKNAGQ